MLHRLEVGGFGLRLEAGLVRRSAGSCHRKIVVRLRWLLGFDILHPYSVRHIAACANPVASRPQVLAPVTFLQHRKLARNNRCELRPFKCCTARLTERRGGIDTSKCTWSRFTDPAWITISCAIAVSRINSRQRWPTSPPSTWHRYFVIHTR